MSIKSCTRHEVNTVKSSFIGPLGMLSQQIYNIYHVSTGLLQYVHSFKRYCPRSAKNRAPNFLYPLGRDEHLLVCSPRLLGTRPDVTGLTNFERDRSPLKLVNNRKQNDDPILIAGVSLFHR